MKPYCLLWIIVALLGACSSVEERASIPPAPATESAGTPEGPSAPVPLERVNISYPAISPGNASVFVAKEYGLFASHGIDAEVSHIQGSSRLVAAIASGEAPIGNLGGPQVIEAVLSGMDLVMLGGAIPVHVFTIYGQPEISSPQDLRGRTIGVGTVGDASYAAFRAGLRRFGIDPDREVNFLQVGGEPERLAALQQRIIDAAALVPPATILARKAGFRMILDLTTQNLPYQAAGFVTTRRYRTEHENTVRQALRGWVEGVYFAKAKREATIGALGKFLRVEDREALEEGYEVYVARGFTLEPYPSVEGLRAILEESAARRPEAALAKTEDFIDTRLLKELEDTGFLRQLKQKYGL